MNTIGRSDGIARALLSFWVVVFLSVVLQACGSGSSSSSPFPYHETVHEGRDAANETLASTQAASISVAFVDGERLVWAETFADPTKDAPTPETMYPVCSVSKVIAAIAVMKLVDMGLVSLDAPLTRYVPSFRMASEGYTSITVRMLLNHSSGFPGSDYRNAVSYSPLPFSYSAQVLQTISTERLKHAPGYMNVYCNDGFTMIEEIVLATTGKSYVRFVQEEILTPLGMTHSGYGVSSFPAGSHAKRYASGSATPAPPVFLNVFGSGGLYSTPTDMAKVAMMLNGGGRIGKVRILEPSSVAAMGVDQTVSGFNPVKSKSLAYGLGWDTVIEPALDSAGVVGWMKGGDFALNGAVIVVVPSERLGVVVMGSSGSFNSSSGATIAQRILLKALAEKGRIVMPARITPTARPERAPDAAAINSALGYYANHATFMRVVRNGTGMLDIQKYDPPAPDSAGAWTPVMTGLKYRADGTFSSDASPSTSYSFISAAGRQYAVEQSLMGSAFCYDHSISFQKIAEPPSLPTPWAARAGKVWLLTNEYPDCEDGWETPVLMLSAVGNFFFINRGNLQMVDPTFSDDRAVMMLLIPQMEGKELDDAVVQTGVREGWILLGSYLYRPLDTVTALKNGTVTVDSDISEWRALDCTDTVRTIAILPSTGGNGLWRIYNKNFDLKQSGQGTGTVTLSGEKFYLVFHSAVTISGL